MVEEPVEDMVIPNFLSPPPTGQSFGKSLTNTHINKIPYCLKLALTYYKKCGGLKD